MDLSFAHPSLIIIILCVAFKRWQITQSALCVEIHLADPQVDRYIFSLPSIAAKGQAHCSDSNLL